MKFLKKYILIWIIILAAILRLWNLGFVPPSPDWDEASLGYNAYSILETGKDEYGKTFPVILQSFNDYKPALYAYLIIPFIKVFDLNMISVRLPGALFGIILVWTTYHLVKELFGEKEKRLALVSSFLVAISPWDLQFSRVAFESQVGVVLNVIAIVFFLKGLRKYGYLILAGIFASLSIYVYQSEKVYLPILFVVLIVIHWKDILRIPKKWIFSAILIGILLSVPMLSDILTNKESLTRARGVSIFSDQTQLLKRNALKISEDSENRDIFGLVLDNRRIEYGKAVISGYISHFDFNWLFLKGDIERHHAPSMGLMYLFELPFLLLGIYVLLFGNYSKKAKLTLFSILLVAPIPASITNDVPHAVRSMNFLPTIQILVAFGLVSGFVYLNRMKHNARYLLFAAFILVFVFNFAYYLNQYFVQQNYYFSQNWQYGYKQAVDYIGPNIDKYEKIVVSSDRPLDQSYIFFLFYLKYPPVQYQKEAREAGGLRNSHSFGKFEFRTIKPGEDVSAHNTLFIGRSSDFPPNANIIYRIRYLNGDEAMVIVGK